MSTSHFFNSCNDQEVVRIQRENAEHEARWRRCHLRDDDRNYNTDASNDAAEKPATNKDCNDSGVSRKIAQSLLDPSHPFNPNNAAKNLVIFGF